MGVSLLRILSADDLRTLLPYETLIPAIRDAMIAVSRGEAIMPLRQFVELGDVGGVGVMAGHLRADEMAGVKLVAFPKRPSVDSHAGLVALFMGPELVPVAVLPAGALTACRTAAATAVATDALALPQASKLAILGTGAQAEAHCAALRHVRPFADIRIWGRSHDKAAVLAERVPGARAVVTISEAVDGAQVVCTLTASALPILTGEALAPGMHVNLVGASVAERREVDDDGVARARLFVDYRASAAAQAGELRGPFDMNHVVAEIGEVLAGATGRRDAEEITMYKSLGIAAQDIAAARLALEGAIDRKLGVEAAL